MALASFSAGNRLLELCDLVVYKTRLTWCRQTLSDVPELQFLHVIDAIKSPSEMSIWQAACHIAQGAVDAAKLFFFFYKNDYAILKNEHILTYTCVYFRPVCLIAMRAYFGLSC